MFRPGCLLLVTAISLAIPSAPRTCRADGEIRRLHYSGQLIQRDIQGTGVPVRSFALHAWISAHNDGRQIVCRLDDEDHRGLAWFERCVTIAPGDLTVPRLRHVHLDRPYLISVPAPLFAHPVPLEPEAHWEAAWENRKVEFTVAGEERVGPRACWRIDGSSTTGRSQTLRVERDSDIVVSASLRVFIGQGERFELLLKLENDETLSPADGARELQAPQALLALQEKLGLEAAEGPRFLSSAQIAEIEAAIPNLQSLAAGASWERFVQQVVADVAAERQRGQSLEMLAARRVGKAAPDFHLTGADGRPLDRSGDAGQVVVLHFWDYRGTPEAPFGQVGYLDFLANKCAKDGVRVYGIAIDERLADAELAPLARREVRQFCSQFIRVSYPVAIDDGSLLGVFGDPRPLSASLPLWIVIGRDGTVLHHKAGLYLIDPNRGLEELNAIVSQAATN